MELDNEKLIHLAHQLPGEALDQDAIQKAVTQMLTAFGEDPSRSGLERTPDRVARMYEELLAGYRVDPIALVNGAMFEEKYDAMVVVRDIEYYSLCEHHLLPFYGKCHVAYIPNGKIIGLSKIPRIVEMYARRLQVQERLTQQIAGCLDQVLAPQGVAVVIEAYHLCMAMRGVEKQNAWMTTSAMRGIFESSTRTREEFLVLIRGISSRAR